ncbi:hypothetical protein LAZ67_2002849 [Cordylochernes scorpioides]|uniref:Transposase n=1 Tax=Cordylochernes scorpioides TaxID=51811 RepID=A0ABY6K567_9ARAC|nr:hypothetical protein LAZ67_2002849 [Cordylochernes scorpioides]
MRNLREAIRQKRPDLWKNKIWLLHHDNAPAHTSLLVRDLLAKNNTLISRSHRIPQIWPPCDFFLFLKLERPMKGRRYATLDEIKRASKRLLEKSRNGESRQRSDREPMISDMSRLSFNKCIRSVRSLARNWNRVQIKEICGMLNHAIMRKEHRENSQSGNTPFDPEREIAGQIVFRCKTQHRRESRLKSLPSRNLVQKGVAELPTRHGNRTAMWPKPCDKFHTFDLTSSIQCSRQQATINFTEATSVYKLYMERLQRQQEYKPRPSFLTELSHNFRSASDSMELPLVNVSTCELRSVIRFLTAKNETAVVHDDERSGRPVTATDNAVVAAVRNVDEADRRVTIDEIMIRLPPGIEIGRFSIGTIMSDVLNFRKVCARWVPRLLLENHKQQRMEAARAFLEMH